MKHSLAQSKIKARQAFVQKLVVPCEPDSGAQTTQDYPILGITKLTAMSGYKAVFLGSHSKAISARYQSNTPKGTETVMGMPV
jgi:hypothetical protein